MREQLDELSEHVLESAVAGIEAAWRAESTPTLAQFLPDADTELRRTLQAFRDPIRPPVEPEDRKELKQEG